MGLFLDFCVATPGLDVANDGLAALMDMDMLRDSSGESSVDLHEHRHLLRPLMERCLGAFYKRSGSLHDQRRGATLVLSPTSSLIDFDWVTVSFTQVRFLRPRTIS
jgi:hypothetical protein